MKLKNLTDTFFTTNTTSIDQAEEFGRHVLGHQYSLHWTNWRIWHTRSWSQIIPPLKKLEGLTGTFLITNTPTIEEAEKFDRHVLHHQYSLHWGNWGVWQTRFRSPILPPIGGTNELEKHVLDHQYTLHLWSWRVWQTRSSSPILPQLVKLKSLTDTLLITNTSSIEGANEFVRHDLITNIPSIYEAE